MIRDPVCGMQILAYRAVVSLLPYVAERQAPPADLKQRILARIVSGGGPERATIR